MKNILDRLIFALDAKGYKKHGRATQLSGLTGYSVGMISDVLRGKTEISERLLKIFCRELQLSEDWLRSGKGEMFPKESTEPQKAAPKAEMDEIDQLERELREAKEKLSTAEFYRVMAGVYEVLEEMRKERKGDK